MTHPRKEIRAAVVSWLKGEGEAEPRTEAGAKVYDSRDIPLHGAVLPAIVVYTVSDDIDKDHNDDGGPQRRVMLLRIDCYQSEEAEDGAGDVDDLAMQVEAALRANPTLGEKVESARLARTEMAYAEQGDVGLYAAVLDVDIVYWVHLVEESGTRPRLFVGFDPETGPGNEGRYFEVGSVEGLPDV